MKRQYSIDINKNHKIIVGEGESDRNFFAAFCEKNSIDLFDFAFTGMANSNYNPSGFDNFKNFLVVLERLNGFLNLTDLILVCDSTDDPSKRITALRRQIRDVNKILGRQLYDENSTPNIVSSAGAPRVHVLMVPIGRQGGIETVCFDVARDALNDSNANGTEKEVWVNAFADLACVNWTIEKRDKLRLQALISAAWHKKPDMHFSQLFDITGDKLVPLDGQAFHDIRKFLKDVASL